MEDHKEESSGKDRLVAFLHGLAEFKTPVETISELAKHEKVDNSGSWTEAEMESELLYWVQLYLTHLGTPLEYIIPCARAIVTEVFGGNFRTKDFEAPPAQVIDSGSGDAFPDYERNGHFGAEKQPDHMSNGDTAVGQTVPVLSAKGLYSFAVEKANEMLTHWKNDTPNFEPVRLPHQISIWVTKNKRPSMEDRYVVIPDLRSAVDLKGIKEPVSFYAVYDGHAGMVAASYAAAHLHRLLCTSKHFPDHMSEALKEAFVATDELYTVKGQRDRDHSGTTAVVSVVHQKKLYIAWVGDSEATIVQAGRASKLVEPRHIASNDAERSRVESEGGSVILNQGGWRVGAVLSVTRAIGQLDKSGQIELVPNSTNKHQPRKICQPVFGDFDFKPFVTANPDVKVVELTGNEDYLILACDGLWDELSPQSAMRETNRFLLEHPDRPLDVAKALSEKARKSGSLDNITVIVVMLKPVEQIIEDLRRSVPDSTATNQDDLSGSSLNNSNNSQDDFADLAEAADITELEFDPSGTNPFDTTPLDPSVLGDFGTPDRSSTTDTDWKFQRNPFDSGDKMNEDEALNVLDQAIGGGHSPVAMQTNQDLLNFDMGTPVHNNETHQLDHFSSPTTPPTATDAFSKSNVESDVKVPDFVKVFEQPASDGADQIDRPSENEAASPPRSTEPSAPPLPPNDTTGDLLSLDDAPKDTSQTSASTVEIPAEQAITGAAVAASTVAVASIATAAKSGTGSKSSPATKPSTKDAGKTSANTTPKTALKTAAVQQKSSPSARAAPSARMTPASIAAKTTPTTSATKTPPVKKPDGTPTSAPMKHRLPDTPRPAATPRTATTSASEPKTAPKPPTRAPLKTPSSSVKAGETASENKPSDAPKKPTATPRASVPATPRAAGTPGAATAPRKTPTTATRMAAKPIEKKLDSDGKMGEEKPGEPVPSTSAAEPAKKTPATPRALPSTPKTRPTPSAATKPGEKKATEVKGEKPNEVKPTESLRGKPSPTQPSKPAVPSRLHTGTTPQTKAKPPAASSISTTPTTPKPSARATPKTPEGTAKTGVPTGNGIAKTGDLKSKASPATKKSSATKSTPTPGSKSAKVPPEGTPAKINGDAGTDGAHVDTPHTDVAALPEKDYSQLNGNVAQQENGERHEDFSEQQEIQNENHALVV